MKKDREELRKVNEMDVLKRLKDIMEEKQMSEYKLSKLSGVPQSTINSMFRKYNNPSIYTLECLCRGLNISISEFFYEEETPYQLSQNNDLTLLISEWNHLNYKQRKALLSFLTTITNGN